MWEVLWNELEGIFSNMPKQDICIQDNAGNMSKI